MIPTNILDKVGRNLHLQPGHPIDTVRRKVESCFHLFKFFNTLSPYVSVRNNFDRLLVPADHPSRSPSDTYYLDEQTVLRTHTSAHQASLLAQGERCFLVTGDVYRKDEIDRFHYPVFHQTEGVLVHPYSTDFGPDNLMRNFLKQVIGKLFPPGTESRFVESQFPFTDPSWEMEILWNGSWVEVLGCGVIRREILQECDVNLTHGANGWAFGMGLDRLAMILYDIPDIRLLWSRDERFLGQFKEGVVSRFRPFSDEPPCYKDLSLWVGDDFSQGDFLQTVRQLGGDDVEAVTLVEEYRGASGRRSLLYRVTYRSMERTLTNFEVNEKQAAVRLAAAQMPGVELR